MGSNNTIQIFEYDPLVVGKAYENTNGNYTVFENKHFELLAQYLTKNPGCPYYVLYHKRIKFQQYVGVIRVSNLTVEVLPKTDRHPDQKGIWQKVLLQMLIMSLKVAGTTSTHADISIRKHSVLETYLTQFIREVELLVHRGLVKKYRSQTENQNALKGKLQIGKHIVRNAIHKERFYVSHTVYDRDNIFNFILQAALRCIVSMRTSMSLQRDAESLLLFFPECSPKPINEMVFSNLTYDRKTEGYRTAMDLARIILMNYHPDIRGGNNHILAIMFDMNLLWETFIYVMLKRANNRLRLGYELKAQAKSLFWKPEDGNNLRLKPDIVLQKGGNNIVIDTKWKYQSKPSVEDVRQLYAYGHYFDSSANYLLYPDQFEQGNKVLMKNGDFYKPGSKDLNESEMSCGLIFADLLIDGKLNRGIGEEILMSLG